MSDVAQSSVDFNRVETALSHLTDAELAALEDDLDFCNFTGFPSPRVLEILKELSLLDQGWTDMHNRKPEAEVPPAF